MKKNRSIVGLLLAYLLAGAVTTAPAAVLVRWVHNQSNQINGQIEDTTGSVASAADTSVVGTGMSGGYESSGTITNLPAGGGFGSGLDYVAPYAVGAANTENGTTSQHYRSSGWGSTPNTAKRVVYQLTMAATVDSTVNQLEGIQFNLANAGTTGPRGFEVTYRIGTSGSFISLGTTRTPTNVANEYGLFTFNLPTPATLSPNDVVEFRLLGYTPQGTQNIRLDNVAITAIPEPGMAGLAIAGATFAVFVRRCRRKRNSAER